MLDTPRHVGDTMRDMQNNGKDLSATEVVQWLKDQAKAFQHMATQIEAAFNLGKPPANTPQLPKLAIINARDIQDAVRDKAMRVADLAKRFDVHEGHIRQIIDAPDSGLMVGDRGWIKLKPVVVMGGP